MRISIIRYASLLLLVCASAADAQPLKLGSSREEVMTIIYRAGTHSDTLRELSVPADQPADVVRAELKKVDPASRTAHRQVIRMAPVSMFGLDGYCRIVFDSSGRLHSYYWIRGEMKDRLPGPGWTRILRWTSDVTLDAYQRARDSINIHFPASSWGEEPERLWAESMWRTETDELQLTWEAGTLILDHRLQE
jgi:hypothetical protein